MPLTLSLPLPDAVEAAETLRAYANGNHGPLLSKLEGMSLGVTESEQEYWQEEVAKVKRYAAKYPGLDKPGSASGAPVAEIITASPRKV